MDVGDAGDRREFLHQQVFQLLAIADDDLEQVVVFAGDVVAFEHVGELADAVAEDVDVFAGVALEADVDKTEQVKAELFAVEQRSVALDEACLFQAAQAGVDGGGREVQAAGQLGVGDAALLLEGIKNCTIVIINGVHIEYNKYQKPNLSNFIHPMANIP